MEFEIQGLDSLMSKLAQLGGCVEKAAADGINKTLEDITSDAVENCPVDTGDLQNSIMPYYNAHKAEPSENITSAVGSNSDHAVYVELGTGPIGETTPVPGKADIPVSYTQKGWTYYDEKLGRFVHTKGQPAQPYLYPAFTNHYKETSQNIKSVADKEIGRLCK